ncbi:MAG: diaminopimelate decarboxylase [Polyangiaceae bacterium]|nr:diaminopimelate decarboxylase [Polyangiaceae bacterium]
MNRRLIEDLAARFGTPLYLYDGGCLERQHRALRSCLPPAFGLYFAVKANPLPGILRLFRRLGCGAEAASEGELRLAISAGFSPEDVVYTCPGKTRAGVELALRSGISHITVESLDEAELIDSTAAAEGAAVGAVIRVNPAEPRGLTAGSAELRMTGGPSQFGVDEEELGALVEHVRKWLPRLRLSGLHVYSGTQVLSAEALLRDAERTLEMSARVSRELGIELGLIDIGGGFGVPYQGGGGEIDLRALKEGYVDLWARYAGRLGAARVIAESGRFLAADGGVFVTRVLSTKVSRGIRFVICDGGYSHHPASAYIGRYGRNRYPVEAVEPSGERERVTVVGPTGTPVDILARDVWLHRVRAGDLLVVGKSGAYGYTNSCQLFFSAPSPAEVMIHEGEVRVLRERGRLSAITEPPEAS